jgi:uncharacterized protein YggT (Ycf19 family)
MDPNATERPVYDDGSTEPVQPVERVQPVAPVRPVEPARPVEYRRSVVQTEEISPLARVGQVIYVILGIVIMLIAIRVLLKALAANTGAAFTSFIYNITDPLVAPFQGIFATPSSSRGSVFEFSSLVAIVVYALIAWAIVRLLDIAGRRTTTTT